MRSFLDRSTMAPALPFVDRGRDKLEDKTMTDKKRLLIAFATGAAAGAVAAYLTAPRTGKEMRASLQSWARDAREKAVLIPTAIRHAVERGTKAGKEAFAESYRGENGHQTHA